MESTLLEAGVLHSTRVDSLVESPVEGTAWWHITLVDGEAIVELLVVAGEPPRPTREEIVGGRVDDAITFHAFPGFSGLEMVRGITMVSPETHGILITGPGSPHLERLARDSGAFDSCEKPCEFRALADAVARALVTLERGRAFRPEEAEAG